MRIVFGRFGSCSGLGLGHSFTLYSFEGANAGLQVRACTDLIRFKISGGHNEKATPVPIPNTAVKLLSADDTWLETAWENRSLPE